MKVLRTLMDGYADWKRVVFKGEYPEDISFRTTILHLRAIGAWTSNPSEESFSYTIVNTGLMVALTSFVLTVTCDLYEASADFVTFGDDLCVLVGLYLILFKIILYRIYKSNIVLILNEYSSLHKKFMRGSTAVRKIQRYQYIEEVVLFYIFTLLGNILFVAVAFQPILSGQTRTLPMRARFPFSIDDGRVFTGVYAFQVICIFLNIKSIVYIDNIGCCFINQTSVNLKILCQRFREYSRMGMNRARLADIVYDHQRIIRLIEYINKYYYLNYVAQIGASTFLICLTAFEAQLARGQPIVALKFQTYMISAFMQLLYWCWVGNKVRFDVATAAYEIEWLPQSPQFRRDLMFVIMRAQKPLTFRAPPLYGFDFQSFASILSSSYSYFTLLKTLND